MKYRHVNPDQFYQGLPAGDIDDSELNAEQQITLGAAVAAGVYEPINEAPVRKPRKEIPDDKPEPQN